MSTAFVSCAAFQEVTWTGASVCAYTDERAVFRLALAGGAAWHAPLTARLLTDETKRAGRYRREADRQRFTYARSVLRLLTSKYLNREPGQIRFVAGVNQKPELQNGDGWHVNVSHAGDWILLTIGRTPVGIDVEYINPELVADDLISRSFSPEEQRQIRDSAESWSLFYTFWTRKESLVKATAKGIDDDFHLVPALDGHHVTDSRRIGAGGHWTVCSFKLGDDYAAAVAGASASIPTRFYTIDDAWLAANSIL